MLVQKTYTKEDKRAVKCQSSLWRKAVGCLSRLLLGLVALLLFLPLLMRLRRAIMGNPQQQRSIMILKLPRSGSSWFTESLNRLPFVYISKEVIQSSDVDRMKAERATDVVTDAIVTSSVQEHLLETLLAPTGKLASRLSIFPDGRFVEDFYLHDSFKFLRDSKYVGFSLNPEHLMALSDFSFLKDLPPLYDSSIASIASPLSSTSSSSSLISSKSRLYVVVYVRYNLVKSTISSFLGDRLHMVCGVSNLRRRDGRSSSSRSSGQFNNSKIVDEVEEALLCSDFRLNNQISWNVSEFIAQVNRWNSRYDSFVSTIEEDAYLSRYSGRQVVVYYERLQRGLVGAMQDLFRDLDAPEDEIRTIGEVLAPEGGAHNIGWKKRASDDISLVLTRYDEIVAFLSKFEAACRCYLDLLSDGNKASNGIDILMSKINGERGNNSDRPRIGYGCRGLFIDIKKGCYKM